MITFSYTTKLMTLAWSAIILSAVYCQADHYQLSELNCLMVSPEKDNSRRIPAVNKCAYTAYGYQKREDIESCQFLTNRKLPLDPELYRPVTNAIETVVYANKYCAICNNDAAQLSSSFNSWEMYWQKDFNACDRLKDRVQRSEIDDIHHLTQMFVRTGANLVAKRFDNTQLECTMNGKWPFHLIRHVMPCLYENLDTGINSRLRKCQYAEKNGRICTYMRLHEDGLVFIFQNDKRIPLSQNVFEYDFAPGQYYQKTEYPGVYFICDLPGTIYDGMNFVKILIVVISLILLAINLGINSNKRYLRQNNTNKLLYLYMLGLVLMLVILLLIYLSHPVPCVAFYLAQFLWAYHLFWSMLIFIEFCLMALCTAHNHTISDIPSLGIRYLIYFIFGFAIPFALPVIYYFGVLILNENYREDLSQLPFSDYYIQRELEYTCPKIPNHLGVLCTSYERFGSKYYEDMLKFFLLPSFYFFLPVVFVLISAAVLYNYFNYRSTGIGSIPYKDHLIVLTKMALIMGIHWILYIIYTNFGHDHSIRILGVSLDTVCQLVIDLHGIIVFVVFGAETCIGFIMNMFDCEYKSVSQQERNNDNVEIS